MLTLLLLLTLLAVGIGIDIALMWGSVRLLGRAPRLRRVLLVEGGIAVAIVAMAIAGQLSPWSDHPSVLVRAVQVLGTLAIQVGVVWLIIWRGFGLSVLGAVAVVAMRVGWSLVGIVLAVLLIRPFVMEAFSINSGAMSPSAVGPHMQSVCGQCGGMLIVPVVSGRQILRPLPEGICTKCRSIGKSGSPQGAVCGQDLVLVNKLARPGRWEIAAYRSEDGVRLCRVVGLPGETVSISEGDVFINGSKLAVPAALTGQKYTGPRGLSMQYGLEDRPCTLKAGEYFLLGDFSTIANDSRFIGPVDEKDIIGLAGLRYWPVGRIGVP